MKKIISIALLVVLIGCFLILFNLEKFTKTDSVIIDKNGEKVEQINVDNNNIGHWRRLF